MSEHDYLSTACHHGLHPRCRRTCKFCDTPCRCDCHQRSRHPSGAGPDPLDPILRSRPEIVTPPGVVRELFAKEFAKELARRGHPWDG